MGTGQNGFPGGGRRGILLKGQLARTLVGLIVTAIAGYISFYITLPALNIHATEFYVFAVFLCAVYFACVLVTSGIRITGGLPEYFQFVKKQGKLPAVVLIVLAALYVFGSVSSMVIFRAGAYSKLLKIEQGDFTRDVEEISFDKIPLLDKESAQKLGDRKLGELSDMVSQFEVSEDYTQINYKNRPVRVTPLMYGDVIKWFNNRAQGLPAFLIIDMASQEADVVRLKEGIKYSQSEHFGRKIERYLRFRYPTFMFDLPTFEVDDGNNSYWICPRIVKTIGLFGGTDIRGAVLVNAVTGEAQYYEDVPSWVDRVFTAELITEQYDYYGQYHNGFINSIFGQKDVTVTTSGYNYIAMNDDVYVYTGITSVGGDQSNIGFILTNERTKATKYYPCAGATETSAMSSAEGVVQHLAYEATFPLLLNISSQPTYFMALKDNARLVKMYAMVNVGQYQIVATGATVSACEQAYIALMEQNSIIKQAVPVETEAKGKIAEIRTAVRDGNSYYYLRLEGEKVFYAVPASQSELVVILNVGDEVSIRYDETSGGEIRTAFSVKRAGAG